MSNSVWYKEVDTSIFNLLRKLVGKDLQVFFNTERDLLKETPKYPYAKILHLGEKFDFNRYDPQKQVTLVEEGQVTLEESALPYTLEYQIELISNSNNLHNSTSIKWASKIRPFFQLDVIDNGGVTRSCFVSASRPKTIEENSKDDKTTFRYVVRLKVRVELDETDDSTTTIHKTPQHGLQLNI